MKSTIIFKEAIETYGIDNQMNVVIEEMSELTKEICKYKRGFDNRKNIIEEMADVFIMLYQLQIMLDITDYELVEMAGHKLSRLQERIKEENKNERTK